MRNIHIIYILGCSILITSLAQNPGASNYIQPNITVDLDLIQSESQIIVIGSIITDTDITDLRIKVDVLTDDRRPIYNLIDVTANSIENGPLTLKDLNSGNDIAFSLEYLYGKYFVALKISEGNPPINNIELVREFQTKLVDKLVNIPIDMPITAIQSQQYKYFLPNESLNVARDLNTYFQLNWTEEQIVAASEKIKNGIFPKYQGGFNDLNVLFNDLKQTLSLTIDQSQIDRFIMDIENDVIRIKTDAPIPSISDEILRNFLSAPSDSSAPFLTGKVYVARIYVNDTSNTWSPDDRTTATQQILLAENQISTWSPGAANVQWFNGSLLVNLSYMPNYSWNSGNYQWMEDAVIAAGYSSTATFAQAIKTSYGVDRVIQLFLPHIAGRSYALPYPGFGYGERASVFFYDFCLILCVRNDEGPYKHESLHLFGACDEYASSNCNYGCGQCTITYDSFRSFYLNSGNCEACTANPVACVMRSGANDNHAMNDFICNFTRGQIGWRDYDGDGKLDPFDACPSQWGAADNGCPCTYSINPSSQAFASSGGSGNFNVMTQSGCPWNAVSNDGWITITSGSNGSGNGQVNFSVALNTGVNPRTGTITITGGNTFTVTQAADNTPPTGSIIINNSANYTNSTSVTLTLSASDLNGVTQMCISNTTSCSSWETYVTSKSWILTTGDGTKTVYVWYKDGVGNTNTSPYSDTIILDVTAPTNGNLSATAGNAQVSLSWSGFSDATSGIGKYKLVYSTGSVPSSCSVGTQIYYDSGTSYVHTGLTNGTTYYYRLCAIDNAGNTSSGATASAKPQGSGETAPSATATASTSCPNIITLNWTTPTPPSGKTVAGYNVYRSTSPGVNTAGTPYDTLGTILTYIDSNVATSQGTNYYYKIRARYNDSTLGLESNEASTITTQNCSGTTPGSPTLSSPSNGEAYVCPLVGRQFSWSAPTTGAPPFTYTIQVTLLSDTGYSSAVINISGLNNTNYIASSTTLLANTAYRWHVRATNTDDGPWAEATFTTGTCSGGTCEEYPVVVHTDFQSYPAIYGNIIVWWDDRAYGQGIYGYDMGSDGKLGGGDDPGEFLIALGFFAPDIYENIVIYRVGANPDIYGYNLDTHTTFIINDFASHRHNSLIYGNVVIWRDTRNVEWEIYGCNLPCGTGSELRITNDTAYQVNLAIHGRNIVWEDHRNLAGAGKDIYLYDMGPDGRLGGGDDRGQFRVTTNSFDQEVPAIYENIIVWMDSRNGSPYIYGYDMGPDGQFQTADDVGEFAIASVPSWQEGLKMYENIIVWTSLLGTEGTDIYGYNMSTHTEFPIVTESHNQRYPALYGNTVVWEDSRNGNMDIYGTCLTQSQPTTTLYIPFVVDTADFRSNLGLSNVNSTTANVNVCFYGNDGAYSVCRDATVPQNSYTALNNTIRWVRNLGESSPTNLQGYVRITSDVPIYAMGGPIDNVVNDPSVMDAVTTTVGNGFTPIAQKSGPWSDQVVITNMGTGTATVTLNVYPAGGGTTPASTRTITIGANAQWRNDDLITYMGISPDFWGMFSWTTDQPVLFFFRLYSTSRAGGIYSAHDMSNSGHTTLYIPYVVDTADFRSNIGLSNINLATANVTVCFYGNDGTYSVCRDTTVPQNSYTALNNTIRWVRNLGESSPTNLQGYVRIVSDVPIHAIGGPIDNVVNDPSVMDAVTTTVGNGFTPIAQKGGPWSDQVIITNKGASTANVTLYAYPSGGGSTPVATKAFTIAPNAQWRNDDLIAYMGIIPPYYGMLSWTTDQSVLFFFRIYSTSRMGGIYPGHGII